MGRGGPGRAGPRPRLAQRGADRARRPGCDAVRVQRLLGAARVRLARARHEHRWLAPAGRHQPRIARRTSPSSGTRRRRSGDRPIASRLVPWSSWRRAGRRARRRAGGRDDGRRTQADGERRPSGERLARGQPVVRVGTVSRRAGLGRRSRGLLRRRRRVELVPARPRPLAGVPLERGRDGGDDRRLQPPVARLVPVERPGPDPQGADVRAGRSRRQPRRGRQGILVVPRRRPEQRLAALAVSLPAGCLPVRGPGPRPTARGPSSSPNTS